MSLLYEYRVFLFSGFIQTLLMSLVVAAGTTMVAIVLVIAVRSRQRVIRIAGYTLVEVLRDIPLMVNVLMVYFMLPLVGLGFGPFWSACIAISVWGGANGAQILRAGLNSVGNGQREAAAAFNFGPAKTLLLIVLPQAMPVIIPPYVGLMTAVVQATSLGAVVGAQELLRSGQILIEQTTIMRGGSPAYLVYGSILVVYFILCSLISFAGGRLEAFYKRPYRGDANEDRIESRIHDIEATVQTSA
ncbi:ABC amino acid transporter, inner membrane subunit [Roseibium aggregatum IAM 12614]|uniref:ABC amino acid transporter, inner membrane subunit n=1 Tax=Roseibium aggregatum (strain ATCC 25650 / DSM 13394 / JCM 20685 / NBRC 16684 / NCIMB 2208 / IAM 12614 / B1) TaxID=384765 RepID=A0NZ89_ROSAI|nr:amino acid ABC transporter permease [Roseibium aggregatum]EAV41768.1 ABC amino acid transporter, inner membrane subunit [Roseibium aggregatum IAM 12614]